MPITPVYGFRYQSLTDPPDGPSLGEDLALDVEAKIASVDSTIATIASDLDLAEAKVGSDWRKMQRKTADLSRNNNATPADDNHLNLGTLPANSIWTVDLMLILTSAANAAGDFRGRILFPTDTTMQVGWHGLHLALASLSGADLEAYASVSSIGFTDVIGVGTSTTMSMLIGKGLLVVGAAPAGDLKLQWSQWASNANNTTLKQHSYFSAQRWS